MSEVCFEILICFLAGAGAGLGTGFAGLSAATVITPMLVAFLHLPAYQAIGIALASDVLASAASARTYAKNGCVDIKNGMVMMAGVLSMTVVGSWLSSYVESGTLGGLLHFYDLDSGNKIFVLPYLGAEKYHAPAFQYAESMCGGSRRGVGGIDLRLLRSGRRNDDAHGPNHAVGI